MKRTLSLLLVLVMLLGVLSTGFVASAETAPGFGEELEAKYVDPDRVYSTEARWWLDKACYTDEVLLQEIQNLYDGGFRGVELCMRSDSKSDEKTYAYGSAMWSHKWKLMMHKLLDLGMTVSLTSGTNWATTNVTGLDPDSQEASQVIAMGEAKVAAGATVTALPKPATTRATNKGYFVGAYAVKYVEDISISQAAGRNLAKKTYNGVRVDPSVIIDLSTVTTFTQGETVYDQAINWTAPEDGDYMIFAYWSHGNYKSASPAIDPAYAVNYFDDRGVQKMREYWEANLLNDPELNAKILEGDVQLFMDSIELNPDGGITWWTEDMREEFIARKGYDPLPLLFLVEGLPQVNAVFNAYIDPALGHNDILDKNAREKFVNDWTDVLTQMYIENLLVPMKEWLNSVGIETRAQISYGRSFEITEPSLYVDYPEAEGLNQDEQIDIFRLHTAGAKLQNKVLSSETSTATPLDTGTMQMRLWNAYTQFAAGFQRTIWHIWSTPWGYDDTQTGGTNTSKWPGTATNFDRWGSREATSRDFDELNAHLGRVQQLMQTGVSRTDIGFIHNNWNQGMNAGASIDKNITSMNWQYAHMGVYYRSTELQDNGYTYDYLSPDLLKAEGVYFDETTKTIEPAGYRALVIYQDWLDYDGAELILDWAKKGLPVVILEGAAQRTPFADGKDAALAEIVTELLTLSNVRYAEIYGEAEDFNYFNAVADGYNDGVYAAMQELGVRPYAEFNGANKQLLTQSRKDENGNLYLYAYNYCPNDYHDHSYIDEITTLDHGTVINTEIKMDGIYVPYQIDAWSGEVTELAGYYYENGQTVFPIELCYNNVGLYAFEKVENEKLHVVDTNAAAAYMTENGLVIRATESGTYTAELSDGVVKTFDVEVPAAYDITGWDLTVSSWTSSGEKIWSEETIGDVHTVNSRVTTKLTELTAKLDKMTTWDKIPEIGDKVSGTARYETTINWDSSKADGAIIDFGRDFVSTMEVWVNGVKVGGKISTNPTKVPASVVANYEGVEQFTGGINWIHPKFDIGAYLVDGENTIVLEYSSTLGNVQLGTGAARPSAHTFYNWWSLESVVQPYGPNQAVLTPYVDEEISTVTVNLTGAAAATVEDELAYTVTVEGAEALATVTVDIAVEGFEPEIEAAEGWTVIAQTVEDGKISAVLFNIAGVTGDAEILTVVGAPTGTPADVAVAIENIVLSAYVGEGEEFVSAVYGVKAVETAVDYSIYDVNEDGTVDQLDITRAQRLYGQATTTKADVDKDGEVTIDDLILILNNYSK